MTPPRNLAASVRDRLLQRAKREQRPFDEVLTYYGMERFLYRLGCSSYGTRLVLKGALMLPMWGTSIARSTRDIDMVGRTPMSHEQVAAMVLECLGAAVEPDGLEFPPASLVLSDIRKDDRYRGVRATFEARLERARIRLQLDLGFGDVITPAAVRITYPTLLDAPAPVLSGYPPETSIAEKLNAIVTLGMANSRMKDYFDLWSISRALKLDAATLARAIAATFRHRETAIPPLAPIGLTHAFGADAARQQQWKAFVRRIRAPESPGLARVVDDVAACLVPVLEAAATERAWAATWGPGGPWV